MRVFGQWNGVVKDEGHKLCTLAMLLTRITYGYNVIQELV